ncbi:general L-amino acid transport system substrate-binding protein [Bosea sp. CRIB-10]|uniref:amino acid ABC transporter substrate-binding protein n=1 Tax=Bosea sp. CRIB-10 TaxID=378404 RepID=UPI0008EBBBD3|nr:amino acid ABC transporter substrate-binding protein [Bosea sp. CRIB-10]SFC25260.1 general L-amino acid transport system substrate-binding protein [Bosea sp. CRIB-10]
MLRISARRARNFGSALAGLCLAAALPLAAQAQTTLERIKQRGHLICGTSQGVAGFSLPDAQGQWRGFDTDLCRALAAAIFNDQEKAKYISLASKDRLTVLQSGEIDVLSRTTTWTLGRDAGFGLNFTAINYFDGQGFLVRKSTGVKELKALNGASICVAQGTTTELNLADYFRNNGMKYEVIAYAGLDETIQAYEAGRCDAYTTDLSQLAANRMKLKAPAEHDLLPEMISKEPLGPWVRQGDDGWFDIVRWTVYAMLNAEEFGITQANVEEMVKSANPEIKRLLGAEGKFGESLGLTNDWVVRIVKAVGNYGESFDRHLGAKSPLNLPRGMNRLWTQGGLQYAPPVR